MKPAALVTVVFLSLVALLHIIRLLLQVEVVVGGASVPMWVSVLAVLGPCALALWLWREQRATG